MKLLTPEKDGKVVLDLDDVVQRSITVARNGEKLWPPPPVPGLSGGGSPEIDLGRHAGEGPDANHAATRVGAILAAATAFFFVNAYAPQPIPRHFTVLMLSIVIGFYVIGKVSHSLHTPLMSVTNAISGVIITGALLQVGIDNHVIQALAGVAILLASINIFGGFAVTRRMLSMFSKGP